MTNLFPSVMGDDYSKLEPSVAQFHRTGPGAVAEGALRVRRGSNVAANGLGWLMRVPPAADSIPVRLEVHADRRGEHWRRRFGSQPFESRMWEQQGMLVEAIGPARFSFELSADAGCLVFRTAGCRVLGIPLPRILWPQILVRASPSSTEPQATDVFAILVEMSLPCLGRIVEYSGEMRQIGPAPQVDPEVRA